MPAQAANGDSPVPADLESARKYLREKNFQSSDELAAWVANNERDAADICSKLMRCASVCLPCMLEHARPSLLHARCKRSSPKGMLSCRHRVKYWRDNTVPAQKSTDTGLPYPFKNEWPGYCSLSSLIEWNCDGSGTVKEHALETLDAALTKWSCDVKAGVQNASKGTSSFLWKHTGLCVISALSPTC